MFKVHSAGEIKSNLIGNFQFKVFKIKIKVKKMK